MSFVRASSKSDPAIIKAFFNDALPAGGPRNAQARRANGIQYWPAGNGSSPSHRLMINGIHLRFEDISSDAPLAAKLGQVQAQTETALRLAGADPKLASELSYLLCDGAFVNGDGKAVNQVMAGKAEFGAPASRELNVVVDGDGATVHRRSTWAKCDRLMEGDEKRTIQDRNLLTIDSGVRFFTGKNKQGHVELSARPDYWAHSTAEGAEAAFIGETLKAAPAGSTVWDRFVDALAWLVGALGIRFERAENLGKSQRHFLRYLRGGESLQPDIALTGRHHWLTAADSGTAAIRTYRNALPVLEVDAEISARINDYRICNEEASACRPKDKDSESVQQQQTAQYYELLAEAERTRADLFKPLMSAVADLLWSANRTDEAEFVRSITDVEAGQATRLALEQGWTLGLAIAVTVDIGRLRTEFEKGRTEIYGAEDIIPIFCEAIAAQVQSVAKNVAHPTQIHERLSEAVALNNLIYSLVADESSKLYKAEFQGATVQLTHASGAMLESMRILRNGDARLARSADWVGKMSGAKRSELNMFDPVDYTCMLMLAGVPIAEIRAGLGQI